MPNHAPVFKNPPYKNPDRQSQQWLVREVLRQRDAITEVRKRINRSGSLIALDRDELAEQYGNDPGRLAGALRAQLDKLVSIGLDLGLDPTDELDIFEPEEDAAPSTSVQTGTVPAVAPASLINPFHTPGA